MMVSIDRMEEYKLLPESHPDDMIQLTSPPCPLCGSVTAVWVRRYEFENYKNGIKARDAFPRITEDYIESLLTGIHPQTCQGEERIEVYVKAIRELQNRISEMMNKV